MAYSPAVEKRRPLVEKYFKPEDVEKALRVIQGESGGNEKASGDGGHSIGLFQLNDAGGLGTGMSVEERQDPETNIKVAAQAVYGGSGWKPWGEGATYNGKPFGALGLNVSNQTEDSQTEDFGSTSQTLLDRVMAARDELEAYAESVGGFTLEDGSFMVPNSESANGFSIDLRGQRLAAKLRTAEADFDNLIALSKEGLVGTPQSAAEQFRDSEVLKSQEADRQYQNFRQRLQDVVELENLPLARQQTVSDLITRSQAQQAAIRSGEVSRFSGYQAPRAVAGTDFGPTVESIKSTLPAQAPTSYAINPAALAPTPGGSLKFRLSPPASLPIPSSNYIAPPPVELDPYRKIMKTLPGPDIQGLPSFPPIPSDEYKQLLVPTPRPTPGLGSRFNPVSKLIKPPLSRIFKEGIKDPIASLGRGY